MSRAPPCKVGLVRLCRRVCHEPRHGHPGSARREILRLYQRRADWSTSRVASAMWFTSRTRKTRKTPTARPCFLGGKSRPKYLVSPNFKIGLTTVGRQPGSQFSVHSESEGFQQSRWHVLVVLISAHPLLQLRRTLVFLRRNVQRLDDSLKRTRGENKRLDCFWLRKIAIHPMLPHNAPQRFLIRMLRPTPWSGTNFRFVFAALAIQRNHF